MTDCLHLIPLYPCKVSRVGGCRPLVVTCFMDGFSKGWVARISHPKPGDRFDVSRMFLRPSSVEEHSERGGFKRFELGEGVFEAHSMSGYCQAGKYYFVVHRGWIRLLASIWEAKELL